MQIQITDRIKSDEHFVLLLPGTAMLPQSPLTPQEQEYIKEHYVKEKKEYFFFNRLQQMVHVQFCNHEVSPKELERMRKAGDEIANALVKEQKSSLVIMPVQVKKELVLAMAEGMGLGTYQFQKHKNTDSQKKGIERVKIASGVIDKVEAIALQNLMNATFAARDLVNEPGNVMHASAFAAQMEKLALRAGMEVKVYNKKEIEDLKMEALLAVNRGSKGEPTFTRLEWKPLNAQNEKPIILVGKGLVFDTGGINLKPTPGLETMKSDMAGGAAVFGAIYALAMNKIPLHVIALVPATDNRPGEQAMLPGDIIRMKNGKTIEVINTDAEGRLILADALLYAGEADPALVIDVATLTGSAQMAFGKYAMAGMHQDAETAFGKLMQTGFKVYERIAEMPFWEEYGEEMISDIADLRNIGKGKGGGAITAGKFLAHFVSYPWIHLDIAGVAFAESRDSYRGAGATGVGVRLLYEFLREQVS